MLNKSFRLLSVKRSWRTIHSTHPPIPSLSTRALFSSNSGSGEPFYGSPRVTTKTSPTERWGLAFQSAFTALIDPTRADAVAALAEVTGLVALQSMKERMGSDPMGRRILKEKPLVTATTSANIRSRINSGNGPLTFGQAYKEFLDTHGFDPDERSEVKYVEDPELAYVMLRYRQCHDYWHVLTGLPPTVLGELGLKWLELLQTGLPVAALSATVGSLRLSSQERTILNQHYLPWAVRMSKQSLPLLNIYYELEFDTPLEDLRQRIGMEPATSINH
jgi:ubiquinone biosynthesis protein COQ4